MNTIRKLSVAERKRIAAEAGRNTKEEELTTKLGKILPIRAFKLGPTQFQAEVEHLKAAGRMPSPDELLDVIAETRAEYRDKLLAARRGESRF